MPEGQPRPGDTRSDLMLMAWGCGELPGARSSVGTILLLALGGEGRVRIAHFMQHSWGHGIGRGHLCAPIPLKKG